MTTNAAAIGAQNRIQGNYGEALINALAAAAGLSCAKPELDFGFDRHVEAETGEQIRLQIKTNSTGLAIVNDALRYPLDMESYDRLRADHTVASYLIVVEVPSEQTRWTGRMDSAFVLRRRAFYASLAGEPPSTNTSAITVSLPLANMVSPASLLRLTLGGV